jgi:hypothetical protein
MLKIFFHFLIALLGVLFYNPGYAQLPNAYILNDFKSRFPNITQIKWERDTPTIWEAEFLLKGQETEVYYREEGVYLGTKQKIHFNDLPQKVQTQMINREVKEINILFLANEKTLYCLELKNREGDEDVCFSAEGQITTAPF